MTPGRAIAWTIIALILWGIVIASCSQALARDGAPPGDRGTPIGTIPPLITPAPSVRIPIGTIPPRMTLPPTDTE